MGPIKRICRCRLHLRRDDEVAHAHGLILNQHMQEAKVVGLKDLKADLVEVLHAMILMNHVSTTQILQEAHLNQGHHATVGKQEEASTWMMSNVHLIAHVPNQKGGQPLSAKDEQPRAAKKPSPLEIYLTGTTVHLHTPLPGAISKLIIVPITSMIQRLSPQSAITNVLIAARGLARAAALTRKPQTVPHTDNQERILAHVGGNITAWKPQICFPIQSRATATKVQF